MAQWTKKVPDVPGYYWRRAPNNYGGPDLPSILFVSEGEDEENHRVICHTVIGRGGHEHIEIYEGDEYWDEPIAPPPAASVVSLRRCSLCRFFDVDSTPSYQGREPWRRCLRAGTHSGLPDDGTSLAITADNEVYASWLEVSPDFSCGQFQLIERIGPTK